MDTQYRRISSDCKFATNIFIIFAPVKTHLCLKCLLATFSGARLGKHGMYTDTLGHLVEA